MNSSFFWKRRRGKKKKKKKNQEGKGKAKRTFRKKVGNTQSPSLGLSSGEIFFLKGWSWSWRLDPLEGAMRGTWMSWIEGGGVGRGPRGQVWWFPWLGWGQRSWGDGGRGLIIPLKKGRDGFPLGLSSLFEEGERRRRVSFHPWCRRWLVFSSCCSFLFFF